MGQLSVTIVTSFFVVLTYYLVMFSVFVSATPTNTAERADDTPVQVDTNRNGARLFKPMVYAYNFNRNIRTPFSSSMVGQRLMPAVQHKIQPLELDLLVDDDDFIDKSKRYDDYGHMRFGKRGDSDQFDDYGHMRFGKRAGAD
ncbi:drosulfakinins [Contarinia nasturtii]|uniref:drosulfakinins n=1 Tax=Contarinia nasturtii TaxID=265458 RepID=UPI0012D38F65|nr:drosulfakinins [Contarinia nasturtii]